MKKVKIFLASSIVELPEEKIHLGDFFNFLNEQYLDKGIHFSLIQCETDSTIMGSQQLSVYDPEIRDSDLCLFIFFKKAGDQTKHEFETALENYQKTGQPYILTTIKQVSDSNNFTQEVLDFMNKLDQELKHFYHFYRNLDQLKLWIIRQIMILKLDTTELTTDGNIISINGEKIADLSNIPTFIGNKELMNMKSRYQEVCQRYRTLRKSLIENMENPDENLYKEYSQIATEKSDLEKEIKEKSLDLLQTLQEIAEDTAKGELSDRLRENYRLIESGDYEGALKAVDLDEIKSDIKLHSTLADGMINSLEINAKELYARIDTLERNGLTKETIREIREIYTDIFVLAQKHRVGKEYLLNYSWFLRKQNDYEEAIRIAERLQYYYSEPEIEVSDEAMASLNNTLGVLYFDTQRMKEAEEAHLQALEIQKRLTTNNPATFEPNLAATYNNLGALYANTQKMKEAETAYLQALEIQKRLATNNPATFEPYLATTYNNLGALYAHTQKMKEAEMAHLQALEIRKRLATNNPAFFESELATTYNNLGNLYSTTQRMKEAETAHLQSLEILKRLATNNPATFEPYLATTYNNLGALYAHTQKMKEAEEAFLQALEIRKRLATHNPETFEPYLATTYNNLGALYAHTQKMKEAEMAHLQALEILKKLAKNNPVTFEQNLAKSYNNLGILYSDTQKMKEAEKAYLQGLEILKKLAKNNPVAFEPDLATTYNNLGALYSDTQRNKEAEDAYLKALEIQKRLATNHPAALEPSLARTYYNLGALYSKTQRNKEAEDAYLKALEILKRLAKNNPVAFEPYLATTYNNLGILYSDTQRMKEAKKAYLQALKIRKLIS